MDNRSFEDTRVYVGVFYTRIREDRPGKPGTTPTVLKYSFEELFTNLKQLHPSTDIPLSAALNMTELYRGKPVFFHHNYDAPKLGIVGDCNVTDNVNYTIPRKNSDTFKGKKIKYHALVGSLNIIKEAMDKILADPENRAASEKDLGISIGYYYTWKFEPVWKKDKKENVTLDWNKSMAFTHNYRPEEISLTGNGYQAVRGCGVLKRLGVIENEDPRTSLRQFINLSRGKMGDNTEEFKKLENFIENLETHKKYCHQLGDLMTLSSNTITNFKKKKGTEMSESKEEDVAMKETSEENAETAPEKQLPTKELTAEQKELQEWINMRKLNTETAEREIGKMFIKQAWQSDKQYVQNGKVEMNEATKKFSVFQPQIGNYGRSTLTNIFTDPENKALKEGWQKVLGIAHKHHEQQQKNAKKQKGPPSQTKSEDKSLGMANDNSFLGAKIVEDADSGQSFNAKTFLANFTRSSNDVNAKTHQVLREFMTRKFTQSEL